MADDALMEVVYLAVKDEEFFKALAEDVDDALREAKIQLSESEAARLRQAMNEPTTLTLDLPRFLQELHKKHLMDGGFERWVTCSWVNLFHDRDK